MRTNSEAITAATARHGDYRAGIAITSSLYPDASTHVTNNTYGDAGDALALTFAPLLGPGRARLRMLRSGEALLRHPSVYLGPGRVRGWSRRTVVFTVMQSQETSLRLVPRRGRRLDTVRDGDPPVLGRLPIAEHIARLAADRLSGVAQVSVSQTLRGTATTAHFLGGAVIGADRTKGVIDAEHRVFGYRNLLVCDGAAVPANIGANPSLTITAMAERAMAAIPERNPADA